VPESILEKYKKMPGIRSFFFFLSVATPLFSPAGRVEMAELPVK